MHFTAAFLVALGSFASTALTVSAELSGQYYIVNAYTGITVGRAAVEDRSFNPKKIVVNSEADPWSVQNVGDNKYILSNRNAPTRSVEGAVFADLLGEYEEWVIEQQVISKAYTIVASSDSTGWYLDDDAQDSQVLSKLLIVAPSSPPYYPPSELWNFIPVDEYRK